MKTSQVFVPRPTTKAAEIAKSIVTMVLKQNYVDEDVEKAVNQAILKFADNMKAAAREELKYQRLGVSGQPR